jgi:hypothetical protein
VIRYSLLRRSDGPFRRYSSNDRSAARDAAAQGLPDTLSMAAKAAMSDPDGIRTVGEVMFELESNRLHRPYVARLLYNGVSVGVSDPSMDLASIASGRRNPTALYWILDATPLDLSMIFDSTDPDAELPVGWAGVATHSTVINGGAAVVGNAFQNWHETLTSAVSQIMATSTSTGDAGRLSSPDASGEGNVLWAAPTRSGTVRPTLSTACSYRFGLEGKRTFTISAAFRCVGGPAQVRFELAMHDGGVSRTGSSWIVTVPATVGQGPMQRVTQTVEIAAPAGTRMVNLDPRIYIENGSTATRIEVDDIQVYAGPPRSADAGRRACIPDQDTIAELTWTDAPRRVNRVEVDGDQHLGQITSAAIFTQDTSGGAWTYRNSVGGPGRLAVDFDPVDCWGVRALVEETGAGVGGGVWINEIDPMQMIDATEDLVAFEATWTREADPGSTTTPYGTFEASELDLTLDNTANTWNPGRNASLDVGHRIEVAAGVQYTNLLSNPRADVDASTWPAPVERVVDELPEGVGISTGFKLAAGPPNLTIIREGEALFTLPGDWHRVSGWVRVVGDGATGYLTMVACSATGVVHSELPPQLVTADDGWVYVSGEMQSPGGDNWFYKPCLSITGGDNEVGAIYATRLSMEYLPDGPGTDPLLIDEIVSVGVYYSEPYDTSSESSTVDIKATDRIGRLAELTVDEPVKQGHTVERIVTDLALRYLDLGPDQVMISSAVGQLVFPYAAPAGPLGTYLADIAKSTASTMHMDSLNRLQLTSRSDIGTAPVAEIRSDNAMVSHRRTPGVDVTTSIVTVNAAPLTPALAPDVLWQLPSGGVTIPVGQSREIIATYSTTTPAINIAMGPVTADGPYTVTSAVYYSDRAIITIRNDAVGLPLVVAYFEVSGTALIEGALTARAVHQPSVERYGPRELTVDARLVQTQDQVDTVAQVLLDAFRAIDDDGIRRLPDLTVNALGLIHLEAGDKVTAADADGGVSGDYVLLGRALSYADSALVLNDMRFRAAFDGQLFILDMTPLDDVYVLGY